MPSQKLTTLPTTSMKLLLTIITGMAFSSVLGQDSTVVLDWTEYGKKIQVADSLYLNENYQASAQAFSAAFVFNDQRFSSGDRFHAARAWAMARNKDSAFSNLQMEINRGYYDYKQFKSEKAFKVLKKDTSWKSLVSKVKDNQKREDERLGQYKPVKANLEKVLVLDQKYRKDYMETWKKFGDQSPKLIALQRKIHKADKTNLKYVTKVLDRYGWIGYDTIGIEASNALFLVIQHADSATQEKYLPLLRNAVKQRNAFSWDLALMEDRVLIRRGQKQIYGSQVQCDSSGLKCRVLPIEDEKNVDNRRKAVGLPPLAVYLKPYGIEYKLPD
jgi:hypothetical protein